MHEWNISIISQLFHQNTVSTLRNMTRVPAPHETVGEAVASLESRMTTLSTNVSALSTNVSSLQDQEQLQRQLLEVEARAKSRPCTL